MTSAPEPVPAIRIVVILITIAQQVFASQQQIAEHIAMKLCAANIIGTLTTLHNVSRVIAGFGN